MMYLLIFGLSFVLGFIILFFTGYGDYVFLFFPYIIFPILIGFIIWFGSSFINIQRERNEILSEILDKLEKGNK